MCWDHVLVQVVYGKVQSERSRGSLARQVSEDPLDNPRFLCNIPEALARLLAANIDLDLNTYLLYA